MKKVAAKIFVMLWVKGRILAKIFGVLALGGIFCWLVLQCSCKEQKQLKKLSLINAESLIGQEMGIVVEGPKEIYSGIGIIKVKLDLAVKNLDSTERGVLVRMDEGIKVGDKVTFVTPEIYNHSGLYASVRIAKKVK